MSSVLMKISHEFEVIVLPWATAIPLGFHDGIAQNFGWLYDKAKRQEKQIFKKQLDYNKDFIDLTINLCPQFLAVLTF